MPLQGGWGVGRAFLKEEIVSLTQSGCPASSIAMLALRGRVGHLTEDTADDPEETMGWARGGLPAAGADASRK